MGKFKIAGITLLAWWIGIFGFVEAGEVKTSPAFKKMADGSLFIFAEKDNPVTFTAEKQKGSVTTSISATGGGTTSTGTGPTQTYTPNENAGYYTVTITVNHIGDNAKDCTTNKPFTFTVATAKAEFSDVIRAANIPNSIAPGIEKEIQVTTTPSPLPAGHSIKVVVDNGGSGDNGSASVTAPATATITQSGTIKVKGGTTQTTANKSGKLKLKAQLDGDSNKIVGEGTGFSTCAHITNIRFSGDYWTDSRARRYGMYVITKWDSDDAQNNTALLDKAWIKEIITKGAINNPPWTGDGDVKVQKKFIRGNIMVDGKTYVGGKDEHYVPQSWLGKTAPLNLPAHNGVYTFHQEYDFACDRCGIKVTEPWRHTSGIVDIVHSLEKSANDEYVVVTRKPGGAESLPEAGQPPKPPSAIVATHVIKDKVIDFTIGWTDNSEIEDKFVITIVGPTGATGSYSVGRNIVTYTTKNLLYSPLRGNITIRVRATNFRGESVDVSIPYLVQ